MNLQVNLQNECVAGYLHIKPLKHQSFRLPLVRSICAPFLPQNNHNDNNNSNCNSNNNNNM